MPREQQIENPQGAFGYATTVNTPPFFHSQKIRRYRNMSTLSSIGPGAIVVRAVNLTTGSSFYVSTASGMVVGSTVDEGVFASTRYGHPGVVGVTLTGAAIRTTATTLGVGAPTSEYCDVVEEGPCWVIMTTVTGAAGTTALLAGDFFVNGAATANGGSTANIGNGGIAVGLTSGSLSTAVISSVFGSVDNFVGVVGQVIIAGTSGSTGQLTSQVRGLAWIRPQILNAHALYGARISTA